ncbi:hypothetical protein CY34DRAFT_540148 [Suillus luteus UH-Slu-Lm8-n1]|uniref:Uncharacterized protein n=1 Tax=Suillus luteus UH-Slu-Lm8-n1 TaxID=930992 RepID=A0A0D0AUG7_9AGAM|nr:hypothetical protein CY34DRAFT_540148 [Suillus luteus UH-Slu-Lm8-n1]
MALNSFLLDPAPCYELLSVQYHYGPSCCFQGIVGLQDTFPMLSTRSVSGNSHKCSLIMRSSLETPKAIIKNTMLERWPATLFQSGATFLSQVHSERDR